MLFHAIFFLLHFPIDFITGKTYILLLYITVYHGSFPVAYNVQNIQCLPKRLHFNNVVLLTYMEDHRNQTCMQI